MHSLKNTIIAVGLLGLSFVFYQMSSPDQSNFEEIDPPVVTDLLADTGSANHLKLPSFKSPENGIGLRNPLALRQPSNPQLPSPKITNPLAAPTLPQPKLNQPKLTPPVQPEFKPRPEAKFGFAGKSGPALTPPNEAQQRDQGLITALKKQQAADGSQTKDANQFQANPFAAKAKTPAQSAPFMQDSAVVGASRTDDGDASNRFANVEHPIGITKQPVKSVGNDPYADLNFKTVWPVANALVAEKRFRKPLELLTRFYDNPGLSGPQQQQLDGWLNGLANKVIFSSEHHLSPKYISQPGDTLLELGREWGIPGQLIFKINKNKILGLPDPVRNLSVELPAESNNIPAPAVIPPGTELKKITGPVNARVNLENNTMTLFVEGLYARRYNVVVGTAGSPRSGDFKVVGKLAGGHDWKDVDGSYPPGHPNNHYGKYWIAMEGMLCMHAVPANTQDGHLGCIGLSEEDAEEVFSIFSDGSTISIQ